MEVGRKKIAKHFRPAQKKTRVLRELQRSFGKYDPALFVRFKEEENPIFRGMLRLVRKGKSCDEIREMFLEWTLENLKQEK